jgi:hypothetical protein
VQLAVRILIVTQSIHYIGMPLCLRTGRVVHVCSSVTADQSALYSLEADPSIDLCLSDLTLKYHFASNFFYQFCASRRKFKWVEHK